MYKKVTSMLLILTIGVTPVYGETRSIINNNDHVNVITASKIGTSEQLSEFTNSINQIKDSNFSQLQKNAEKEIQRIKEIEEEKLKQNIENNRKENVRVYQDDVRIISNITIDELNAIFDIKNKPFMKNLSKAFIECEKKYNINAFTMAAIVAQESGWAKSPGGNGTNFTGYCIHNGIEKKGSKFNSGEINIIETARLLSEDYIPTNGKFYCGGSSINDINSKYCLKADGKTVDDNWATQIINIQNDLENIYHKNIKNTLL